MDSTVAIVVSNPDSQRAATPTPKPRRVADSPFDSMAVADVILRSSDNVDFYVMKAFLAYSSRFFSTMFTLPQSNNTDEKGAQDGIVVVEMSERSRPLRYMLLFCYPGPSPTINNIYDIMAVVHMVEKYEMDPIEKRAREVVVHSSAMKDIPLQIIAFAFHHGWKDIGVIAARNILAQPPRFAFFKELEYLGGTAFYHLNEFRYECSKAVLEWILEDFDSNTDSTAPDPVWRVSYNHSDICKAETSFNFFCSDGMPRNKRTQGRRTAWWSEYSGKLSSRLCLSPTGITILNEQELFEEALAAAGHCKQCAPIAYKQLAVYREDLASKIDKIVVKVRYLVDNSCPHLSDHLQRQVPLNIQFVCRGPFEYPDE